MEKAKYTYSKFGGGNGLVIFNTFNRSQLIDTFDVTIFKSRLNCLGFANSYVFVWRYLNEEI